MRRLSAVVLSIVLVLPALAAADTPPAAPQKAVLVTGASTGIGRKITERLAAAGYFVYATARKDADLEALGKIQNVQAVRLDVTSAEDIAAAVDVVTKAGRGLHGLVNNAGIGTGGPVIDSKQEEFELAMNVNALGPVRMTRAFAPLIIAAKGRIVNISSVSGILAGKNTSRLRNEQARRRGVHRLARARDAACRRTASAQSSRETTARRSSTTPPRAWASRRA